MRKVIFGINTTLDGCVDHTKGRGSEEVHAYFTKLIQEADLLVYGRKTYELMVPFWPDMARSQSGTTKFMNDFARTFDATQKVVFSRTLEHVEDANTRLVRTDAAEEIRRLKQEEGGNILLGGVDLPSQLIELGLVDEYCFVVQPAIAGEGTRLMKGINLPEVMELKLVSSKLLGDGSVALHYVKQ